MTSPKNVKSVVFAMLAQQKSDEEILAVKGVGQKSFAKFKAEFEALAVSENFIEQTIEDAQKSITEKGAEEHGKEEKESSQEEESKEAKAPEVKGEPAPTSEYTVAMQKAQNEKQAMIKAVASAEFVPATSVNPMFQSLIDELHHIKKGDFKAICEIVAKAESSELMAGYINGGALMLTGLEGKELVKFAEDTFGYKKARTYMYVSVNKCMTGNEDLLGTITARNINYLLPILNKDIKDDDTLKAQPHMRTLIDEFQRVGLKEMRETRGMDKKKEPPKVEGTPEADKGTTEPDTTAEKPTSFVDKLNNINNLVQSLDADIKAGTITPTEKALLKATAQLLEMLTSTLETDIENAEIVEDKK